MPATAVIVRSTANIEAGATTRASGMLQGLWLLLAVAAVPWAFGVIPRSALAAILVYTGWRLMNVPAGRGLYRERPHEFWIFVVTVVVITVWGVLEGVVVGFGLSAAKLLYTFTHLEVDVQAQEDGKRVDVNLAGAATFMRLPDLTQALQALPKRTEVHVHFGALAYVDHACIEEIRTWEEAYEKSGGTVVIEWDRLDLRTKKLKLQPTTFPPPSAGVPHFGDIEAIELRDKLARTEHQLLEAKRQLSTLEQQARDAGVDVPARDSVV